MRGLRVSQSGDGGLSDGLEGDYYGNDEDERIFPFELEMLEGALMVATGGSLVSGKAAGASLNEDGDDGDLSVQTGGAHMPVTGACCWDAECIACACSTCTCGWDGMQERNGHISALSVALLL